MIDALSQILLILKIKEYYEQLYDILQLRRDRQFLQRHKLRKLTQEEMNNQNSPIC